MSANETFAFDGFISEPTEAMLHMGYGSSPGWIYPDSGNISIHTEQFSAIQGGIQAERW